MQKASRSRTPLQTSDTREPFTALANRQRNCRGSAALRASPFTRSRSYLGRQPCLPDYCRHAQSEIEGHFLVRAGAGEREGGRAPSAELRNFSRAVVTSPRSLRKPRSPAVAWRWYHRHRADDERGATGANGRRGRRHPSLSTQRHSFSVAARGGGGGGGERNNLSAVAWGRVQV